jgi:hypothetical protein
MSPKLDPRMLWGTGPHATWLPRIPSQHQRRCRCRLSKITRELALRGPHSKPRSTSSYPKHTIGYALPTRRFIRYSSLHHSHGLAPVEWEDTNSLPYLALPALAERGARNYYHVPPVKLLLIHIHGCSSHPCVKTFNCCRIRVFLCAAAFSLGVAAVTSSPVPSRDNKVVTDDVFIQRALLRFLRKVRVGMYHQQNLRCLSVTLCPDSPNTPFDKLVETKNCSRSCAPRCKDLRKLQNSSISCILSSRRSRVRSRSVLSG